MSARTFRDDAIVLRTRVFSEADRVVSVLTRSHGQLDCLAKGVRRTRSRFGARVEPFMHVDVQLHRGSTFHYITGSETITAYGAAIAGEYEAYTAANVIAETTYRLSAHASGTVRPLYQQLHGALAALARRAYSPRSIVDAFLIRAVTISGWAVSVSACAECGSPGPLRRFDTQAGGALCDDCAEPSAGGVTTDTLFVMGALLAGNWGDVQASPQLARTTASRLIAGYTQWHLETRVRSLSLVDSDPDLALVQWLHTHPTPAPMETVHDEGVSADVVDAEAVLTTMSAAADGALTDVVLTDVAVAADRQVASARGAE